VTVSTRRAATERDEPRALIRGEAHPPEVEVHFLDGSDAVGHRAIGRLPAG